ncbi:hypothetical protein SAMN04488012_1081 [Palleronia salina]|uniref:Uncharacterized protein n=1 Tax=Palleronia salina TaxID=313368 RepID=A0A1M6IJD1_9RHOB|nr:hypothetical protein [Palleronia salina]SHJ34582.1 hypothetical protein SAMN04488012_1081 [Palleronia salina]
MFHSRVTTGKEARSMSAGELALREFFSHHDEALGNAAVLLADRHGARLLNAIRDGLEQPGSITRRLRRLLLQLRAILFLDEVGEDEWGNEGCFDLLEPEDPIPIRAARKVGEVLKYIGEGQFVSSDYRRYI